MPFQTHFGLDEEDRFSELMVKHKAVVTLDGIASGFTIRGPGIVNYVTIDDNGKPYTMMVEAYLVSELKH